MRFRKLNSKAVQPHLLFYWVKVNDDFDRERTGQLALQMKHLKSCFSRITNPVYEFSLEWSYQAGAWEMSRPNEIPEQQRRCFLEFLDQVFEKDAVSGLVVAFRAGKPSKVATQHSGPPLDLNSLQPHFKTQD